MRAVLCLLAAAALGGQAISLGRSVGFERFLQPPDSVGADSASEEAAEGAAPVILAEEAASEAAPADMVEDDQLKNEVANLEAEVAKKTREEAAKNAEIADLQQAEAAPQSSAVECPTCAALKERIAHLEGLAGNLPATAPSDPQDNDPIIDLQERVRALEAGLQLAPQPSGTNAFPAEDELEARVLQLEAGFGHTTDQTGGEKNQLMAYKVAQMITGSMQTPEHPANDCGNCGGPSAIAFDIAVRQANE